MDADGLLEGLNDGQRRAVTTDAQPLCVLAGAGSGKTRVLTRRIAWRAATGNLDPRHVVALTFTRKAAGELTSRLGNLGKGNLGKGSGLTAGTFHSVAYAQLRNRWADRGMREPAILDRKVGFVARLMPRRAAEGTPPFDVVAEIEWAKARLVAPEGYESAAAAAGRRPPLDLSAIAELYARYEEEKSRRHMVDFDDLLRSCRDALREDRTFAAAQRWRFHHFFVDEFQDVNPAQHELLEAWLGDRLDLCVVGDPNQAIYAWNGADASYLAEMPDRYPSTEVVRLDDNYRSTPQILAAANRVIGGKSPLRANRDPGAAPTIRSASDDRAEAATVARAVRDRYKPDTGRWADQAILVRTHAQAGLMGKALADASVPHRLRVEARGSARVANGDEQQDDTGSTGSTGDTGAARFSGSSGDAVEVVTFHASKGLEWPVVHIAGLEQGLVPIGHARTPEALAEERRLLYVALTRAQEELHCTWAEQRTFGERTVAREPSMFLDRVQGPRPGQVGSGSRRGAPARARAKVRGLGARSVDPSLDPSVLSALRAWRLGIARAAAVPAYVVFNDHTLEAIAAAKPRTTDELLALPGIGQVKASRYGPDLLRLVASAS